MKFVILFHQANGSKLYLKELNHPLEVTTRIGLAMQFDSWSIAGNAISQIVNEQLSLWQKCRVFGGFRYIPI